MSLGRTRMKNDAIMLENNVTRLSHNPMTIGHYKRNDGVQPMYTYNFNSSLSGGQTSQYQQEQQLHQHLTHEQNECLAAQQLLIQQQQQGINITSSNNNNLNCTSDDLYDNIDFHPETINFSDIQLLWKVKEPLNIAFRVSLVAPIILLGILGNLTIIYSMFKFKPFRSKPTNIFILNMAIADLLTTMVCPLAALFSYIYQFYVLGSFICRIEGTIKITCFLVSSYSLIVLSSDWLLCVVQPCRQRITIRQSWFTLIVIWVVSVIMASPLFFWRKLRHRQWKDLEEIWCCELIQYSKYYWVTINFFLIYLPTFFMTIVLVIILAQMDKFEAKLRRSRTSQSNASLTININYRRRIVKILFTYLLTSIICWTPLQVFIIYRHFRTRSKAAAWFFELNFFTSLSASLTAATNPIIFGFLSQPFRRLVKKTFMFKFFDKIMTTNSAQQQQGGAGGAQSPGKNNHNHKNHNNNNNNSNARNQPEEIFVINKTINYQQQSPKIGNNHHMSPSMMSGSRFRDSRKSGTRPSGSNRSSIKINESNSGKQKNYINLTPIKNSTTLSRKQSALSKNNKSIISQQQHNQTITDNNNNMSNNTASNLNTSKRVSFSTVHREPIDLDKQQLNLKIGRSNQGYLYHDEILDNSTRNSSIRGHDEQYDDVQTSGGLNQTTSFMNRNLPIRFGPISAVSMDSINIEENLSQLQRPQDSSLPLEEGDEEDGEKID